MESTREAVTAGAMQEVAPESNDKVYVLELTSDQHEVLANILDDYLSEIRYEIADTENFEYKDMLQQRKELVRGVFEMLRPGKKTS